MTVINLITSKDGANNELLFNKPAVYTHVYGLARIEGREVYQQSICV